MAQPTQEIYFRARKNQIANATAANPAIAANPTIAMIINSIQPNAMASSPFELSLTSLMPNI